MTRTNRSPCLIWAASLLLAWILVAAALGQPPWAQQHSRALMAFGAIKGSDFAWSEAWRLVASQWLHVKPPHMLLNVLVIGGVGLAIETRLGRLAPVLIGLAGGTLGQWVAVVTQPDAFISGASQAYLTLCGLAVAVGGVSRWGRIAAWMAIAVALVLDIVVSGHGAVKPGHLTGLAVGVVTGLALRLGGGRRSS